MASTSTPPPSEIGQVLVQRYEVLRELGKGGMGMVYLCRDLVTGDRVALKRLKHADGGPHRPEEYWWFHQEARAVATLDHPAIVRARDFGTLADNSPYLVMDLLPGRSIHEWMHTTQMAWPVIWMMVDQVLAGLGHAHARGIIHGDLKPSNVMLDMSNPSGPRAYLLDLGLAWLRQYRHDPRLDGTQAPEVAQHAGAGTVGWVAPEQIRKLAPFVGAPTDFYALGCIMYRVLSGKEVFEGTAQEVLRAHKRSPVQPPKLADGIPEDVAMYVLRLLEKKPWARYEFAADARRAWAAVRPTGAKPLEDLVTTRSVSTERVKALAPGLLSLRAAPLVARHHERAELLRMVDDLTTGRERQTMVVMTGEAGVGKSRLVEWLCEHVHETGKMLPLRARYGRIPTPIDGVTGGISTYYGLENADRIMVEQTLMSRWEVTKDDDEALTWVAATAEWLRPSSAGESQAIGPTGKRFVLDRPELRWVVVRRLMQRLTKDRPVLLWLDDLHLASQNTFEMLSRLRLSAPEVPILMLITARSETLATDLDASLRMERLRSEWSGAVMDLEPLGNEETEMLLRSTLPLADDAVRRAVDQTRGNPLFALQLLHAWAGGGYLKLEDGRYRVPADALQGRAITTAELWDERIRAIPIDLRLAAYATAALGDDVRGEVLRALIAALGMEVNSALIVLTRAQILLAGQHDQFRWPHALLQEHLLERLNERPDSPAIYRLAATALAKHPAAWSRRIMKHRVTNFLKAGDDEPAARLMFEFIRASWARGRDTAATLRDLEMLKGRVTGTAAAEYSLWRAEALRHIGRLDEAREQAQTARDAFAVVGDDAREAHALRLLGHIASDLGTLAVARTLLQQAHALFAKLGDERGQAQSEIVLGEIDYLLGDHASAREFLKDAVDRCTKVGDALGRAQCFILLALIELSIGRSPRGRELLIAARAEFDAIGYRLGISQCDIALAHTDHRALDFASARTRVLTARMAFRELQNPRGEAGCERLLAMVAFDSDDFEAARAHAQVALRIYERLNDPWGRCEATVLLAQVALADGASNAGSLVQASVEIALDDAEPRQHRHLTAAWLAQTEGRDADALAEIDHARLCFGDTSRTGDHTPQLLTRLSALGWKGAVAAQLKAWVGQLSDETPSSKISLGRGVC